VRCALEMPQSDSVLRSRSCSSSPAKELGGRPYFEAVGRRRTFVDRRTIQRLRGLSSLVWPCGRYHVAAHRFDGRIAKSAPDVHWTRRGWRLRVVASHQGLDINMKETMRHLTPRRIILRQIEAHRAISRRGSRGFRIPDGEISVLCLNKLWIIP